MMQQKVANRDAKRVDINLSDVTEVVPPYYPRCLLTLWFQFFNDPEMAHKVAHNTVRYQSIVKQAIDSVIPAATQNVEHADVTDVLYVQRISQLEDQRGPVQSIAGAGLSLVLAGQQ